MKTTCSDQELDQNSAICLCSVVVIVCSVVSTSNFVFATTAPGYLDNFSHGAELELNFMNFSISVLGKLHCTLEKVTNCPGHSQVTGSGRRTLRKFMIIGQFGQTIPRILRKRHDRFLEYFGPFFQGFGLHKFFF